MSNKPKPASQSKLTSKQLHFSRCVAGGATQSDAYREAYDVKETTKASTIHVKASQLMANGKVRARVDQLVWLREQAVVASAVTDRDKSLSRIRHLCDHATGHPAEANMLRAAQLLGQSQGIFKDVVMTSKVRTPDEIEAEIMQRLDALDDEVTTDEQDTDQGPVNGSLH